MSSRPLGSEGGNYFCVINQAGGWATAKLQEPGWGHIQGGGKMILGSQAGEGGLLYHDKLLVFPQNA